VKISLLRTKRLLPPYKLFDGTELRYTVHLYSLRCSYTLYNIYISTRERERERFALFARLEAVRVARLTVFLEFYLRNENLANPADSPFHIVDH